MGTILHYHIYKNVFQIFNSLFFLGGGGNFLLSINLNINTENTKVSKCVLLYLIVLKSKHIGERESFLLKIFRSAARKFSTHIRIIVVNVFMVEARLSTPSPVISAWMAVISSSCWKKKNQKFELLVVKLRGFFFQFFI